MALACDYVFQVMGLHRVEICVRPENTKSLRVVEKLGLAEEGMRPAYLHIDGQWRDHRVFRLLTDDYPDGCCATTWSTTFFPGLRWGGRGLNHIVVIRFPTLRLWSPRHTEASP